MSALGGKKLTGLAVGAEALTFGLPITRVQRIPSGSSAYTSSSGSLVTHTIEEVDLDRAFLIYDGFVEGTNPATVLVHAYFEDATTVKVQRREDFDIPWNYQVLVVEGPTVQTVTGTLTFGSGIDLALDSPVDPERTLVFITNDADTPEDSADSKLFARVISSTYISVQRPTSGGTGQQLNFTVFVVGA